MVNRLFLDFDGTLIDVSRRLYILFNELASDSSFTYGEYWRIKRRRITQAEMLRFYFNYDEQRILKFKSQWMAEIENQERLKLDTPFLGVSSFLEKRSELQEIYLITARQHKLYVEKQLEQFGWRDLFKNIFVTEQIETKASIIRANFCLHDSDILIGDTGEDVTAAKTLGIRAFAVSSGFLDADILEEYAPEKILSSVTDLSNF